MRFFSHSPTVFPHTSVLYRWWGVGITRLGACAVHTRTSFLSKEDPHPLLLELQRGDVLLLGGHRRLSSFFIRGVVTHSVLYVGDGQFVHANPDGVETTTVETLFREYDTYILIRAPLTEEQQDAICLYAKERLGMPYDFVLSMQTSRLMYCTELIFRAYAHAGLQLPTHVHPQVLLESVFTVRLHSHAVRFHNGRYTLGAPFPAWERLWKSI